MEEKFPAKKTSEKSEISFQSSSSSSSSSSLFALSNREKGERLAAALLDELCPSDFIDAAGIASGQTTFNEPPARNNLQFIKFTPGEKKYNLQVQQFFPQISNHPDEATLKKGGKLSDDQELFCVAHRGFGPAGGNISVEHAYPYAEIRKNQARLLQYLNANPEIRDAFMAYQSGVMEQYFQYKDEHGHQDKTLRGTRLFYMYSYNALSNTYLICTPCNTCKGDKDSIAWLGDKPFFGENFIHYVKKTYGDFQLGVLFLRAFRADESTQLLSEGSAENFVLPAKGKLAPGLGALIREWIEKIGKSSIDIHSLFQNNTHKDLQKFLQEEHDLLAKATEEDLPQASVVSKFMRKKVKREIQMSSAIQKATLEALKEKQKAALKAFDTLQEITQGQYAEDFLVSALAPTPMSILIPQKEGGTTSSSSSEGETQKMLSDKTQYVVDAYMICNQNAHYIKHACRRVKHHYLKRGYDKPLIMSAIERIHAHCLSLDKQNVIPSQDWKGIYNYMPTALDIMKVENPSATLEDLERETIQYLSDVHKRFAKQHGVAFELVQKAEEEHQKYEEERTLREAAEKKFEAERMEKEVAQAESLEKDKIIFELQHQLELARSGQGKKEQREVDEMKIDSPHEEQSLSSSASSDEDEKDKKGDVEMQVDSPEAKTSPQRAPSSLAPEAVFLQGEAKAEKESKRKRVEEEEGEEAVPPETKRLKKGSSDC